MLDKILKVIITVFGAFLGYSLVNLIEAMKLINISEMGVIGALITVSVSAVFGIIFLYLSNKIIKVAKKVIRFIECEIQRFSINDIVLSSIGLIIGLIIAYLISPPIYNINIPIIGGFVPIIVYMVLAYLGINIPYKKRDDIYNFVRNSRRDNKADKIFSSDKGNDSRTYPKILDTSVIIDGRILDICKTKFIEGPLVIPEFVLEELQHIADSSDSLKRTRGRRGLDILNEIQKNLDIEVIIHDKKFEEEKEVDSKLLKLTKELEGKILTNDYNLNKVAEVQGITVLNINDLANAVKPVVLPGEEMDVEVVKDGKEANQGLAYLDDGTMIVVEGGRKHIGHGIKVIVTSVLQTSAGRMIFAKPKTI